MKRELNIVRIKKTKTIGIIGQKGTGKTYLTKQIAESIKNNGIVFNTIGALEPKGYKIYDVEPREVDKQTAIFTGITEGTHKNIGVNLSQLVKDEIVEFTDNYFKNTTLKDRWLILDEMSDYVNQGSNSSKELERFIRNGRNFGNTFIFNTQRPAHITKNVFNLVDILVVFRLVWKRDIEVIRDMLNNVGVKKPTIEIEHITNQGVGEFVTYYF